MRIHVIELKETKNSQQWHNRNLMDCLRWWNSTTKGYLIEILSLTLVVLKPSSMMLTFSSMTYSEFVTFCERFMHEECKKFYYCEPDMSLMEGLNPISDDVEYSAFIFDAYGTDGVISVYVDHIGVGVDGWHDDDEHESCIDGENEDNIDELRNVAFEFNEDVMHMNRTSNDPFLSKLCVDDEDANNIVDDDNGREVEVNIQTHSIFNELLHWKKQKLILGMRFKGPGQVNSMLCNYVVANGYQLTRLLVRCSKGACTFRLWASWMSDEESFQIKSLKADHNCARNFKFGSLVTYAWIGSHYTKEIVESQKISVRKLRLKSTVKLDMEDGPDGKKYFSKFYCFFQGVKQGRIEGCRRVIGLDGCFLKNGELLCAIGSDANDKIYPIAWAVVNVENKQNWKWFLELLIYDLQLNLGNGFSLMSDQHKGLIEAVKELLPYVEHKQCARNICQNLQKRFTGAIYHTLFWRASKATNEHAFKVVMKEIETLNPDAHQYLMEKDPKTWSRAFFQTGRCCDAVENGFSESFNVVIVDARKKLIITMDKVNLLKKAQRHYQVLPSGLNQFEVRGAIDAYEVDLERKTCSCRLWQLNGYGCAHSVASISFLNRDVEAYVDNMFSTTTFRKAYNYRISPMNSSDMWPETNYTPPLPPINRRMPGRPTTKRKKSTTENIGTHKVSKAGKKIRCSICKEIGHNKATCPQRRPQKLNVKKQKKQKVCVNQNAGQGSTSEPQQHEEVEMTPIEMDTTQNDMQVAPTDVESSSAGDFSHYMQFTPPRCYEGDEGVMGEEADVVEEAVVVEQAVQDEEAEEVDPVIQVDNVNVQEVDKVNPNAQVDNGNVQEVDEVNPNAQVDSGNVQEVAPVNQVQQVCVRPISDILKRIRRRKSERILKLKLGKTIGGVDDLGNSKGKALDVGNLYLSMYDIKGYFSHLSMYERKGCFGHLSMYERKMIRGLTTLQHQHIKVDNPNL
uniref:SWIM-type domain-containing protein n=1 Tax=Lactuca sativa TaxID=4236 RepID=A0A9R1WYV2_LACSA|nr:hypothetical protein LSAT_V11C800426100 [Lactuca sativa]